MMYNDGTTNSVVRVAFYGRGVWESPLYSIITGAPSLFSSNASVLLYPNPTDGEFTVALQGQDNAQIEIYNLLGQTVYTSKLGKGNTELNLGSRPSGVYLYRIATLQGNYISNGKLVLEQ